MAAPILALEGVSKTFRRSGGSVVHAVRSVSLAVADGETVALVGESGSGKSTLGRIALGLVQPDAGRVLLTGRCLGDLAGADLRHVRVAAQPVFQDAAASLNPRRSVRELLAQALRHRRDSVEARSIDLLDSVGLRPGRDYLPRFPHELSGGQRQRLAIARALLKDAPILLLDEATSALDSASERAIQDALDRLMHGRTVIAIAHRLATLKSFDRIIVMDQGRIVDDGPPGVLAARPGPYRELLRKQQLLEPVPEAA